MITRPRYVRGDIPHPTAYTDYFEIEALGGTYIVPLSTAHAVERRLEACGVTEWIEFGDVFGARHRVPARYVYRITESTRATRAALRQFRKTLREEEKEHEDDR